MAESEPWADTATMEAFWSDRAQADLLAAKRGSRDSAARLVERYRDYLLLVANAEVPDLVRPKIGASDLVQQSIADAWQAFGQFNGATELELRGWLRNILLNNLRDAHRKYCQAIKRDPSREVPLQDESSDEWHEQLAVADATPSANAAANEELQLVHQALAKLPEHYARIIHLRNLEYLSFVEIGQRMEMEKDLARKLWERAVKRLARELKQNP